MRAVRLQSPMGKPPGQSCRPPASSAAALPSLLLDGLCAEGCMSMDRAVSDGSLLRSRQNEDELCSPSHMHILLHG